MTRPRMTHRTLNDYLGYDLAFRKVGFIKEHDNII